MPIRFMDHTNAHIDRLVEIAWASQASHKGEYIRIPERREIEVTQLINDEAESAPEAEVTQVDESNREKLPVDLSKFSRPRSLEHDPSLLSKRECCHSEKTEIKWIGIVHAEISAPCRMKTARSSVFVGISYTLDHTRLSRML